MPITTRAIERASGFTQAFHSPGPYGFGECEERHLCEIPTTRPSQFVSVWLTPQFSGAAPRCRLDRPLQLLVIRHGALHQKHHCETPATWAPALCRAATFRHALWPATVP